MAAKYPDYEDWAVQLAYNYTGSELRDGEWFALTQKINGVRATTLIPELVSRGGKVFKGLQHIENELVYLREALFHQSNIKFEFDGELRVADKYIAGMTDNEAFKLSVGLANSSVNMSGKDKLQFIIFDVLIASEFRLNTCSIKYSQRFDWLSIVDYTVKKLNLKYIKTVPIVYSGKDKSQINTWFEYANNQGWEGLMINRDMSYTYNRTKGLLKIKKFDTLDLKIVGYTQGTGKYEHTLGALACKFRDNIVYVGTGFDDMTRDLLWAQRDHLEGKICEVKYKDITYDKATSLPSLQFPVFICLKTDKNKADA